MLFTPSGISSLAIASHSPNAFSSCVLLFLGPLPSSDPGKSSGRAEACGSIDRTNESGKGTLEPVCITLFTASFAPNSTHVAVWLPIVASSAAKISAYNA